MKTTFTSLKIAVLGAEKVGKSAVTVRFLTKRFIGEYSSGSDYSYNSVMSDEDGPVKIEIIDCSDSQDGLTESTLRRYQADAFVIVYSVTESSSLKAAQSELDKITRGKSSSRGPVLLLGNKIDLEHLRQVDSGEVFQIAHKFQCRHEEVSAAENFSAINSCFRELVQDALEIQKLKAKNVKRRKSILGNMSRRIGNVFKRKSLEDLLMRKRLPPLIQTVRRSL